MTLHTRMPFLVMAVAWGLIGVTIPLWRRFGPALVINQTPSEPVGIYHLIRHASGDYRRGMLVLFPVPLSAEAIVYGRHWLRAGVPLLKELTALGGDTVCVSPTHFTVNGRVLGPVLHTDRSGLPLPRLAGCFTLLPGSFFAASTRRAQSFDGRYFGALPLSSILAEARPLWTF